MFRKTIAALVTIAIILGGTSTAAVQAKPGKDLRVIPVIVNGYKIKFPDTEPYMNTDGRTMVPVRFVSEKLGAKVKWEDATQTVIMKYGSKEIRMTIGSKRVGINGEITELDTVAEMYEGRAMVPLRFVSEVLDSKVTWDEGAHAVRVTDAKYQAKIDSGQVDLDPWGRQYSKNYDGGWMKLSDLENTKFYKKNPVSGDNIGYVTKTVTWDLKKYGDQWAEHIRQYYALQLNVDYRTINESKFVESMLPHLAVYSVANIETSRKVLKKYVAWVKENKVITRGYADPEVSQVQDYRDGRISIPVHFKFMIISAKDTSQTFLDNWDVTTSSDSFQLKKNVWYDGYSGVIMDTNHANLKYRSYVIASMENMFMKGHYFYDVIK